MYNQEFNQNFNLSEPNDAFHDAMSNMSGSRTPSLRLNSDGSSFYSPHQRVAPPLFPQTGTEHVADTPATKRFLVVHTDMAEDEMGFSLTKICRAHGISLAVFMTDKYPLATAAPSVTPKRDSTSFPNFSQTTTAPPQTQTPQPTTFEPQQPRLIRSGAPGVEYEVRNGITLALSTPARKPSPAPRQINQQAQGMTRTSISSARGVVPETPFYQESAGLPTSFLVQATPATPAVIAGYTSESQQLRSRSAPRFGYPTTSTPSHPSNRVPSTPPIQFTIPQQSPSVRPEKSPLPSPNLMTSLSNSRSEPVFATPAPKPPIMMTSSSVGSQAGSPKTPQQHQFQQRSKSLDSARQSPNVSKHQPPPISIALSNSKENSTSTTKIQLQLGLPPTAVPTVAAAAAAAASVVQTATPSDSRMVTDDAPPPPSSPIESEPPQHQQRLFSPTTRQEEDEDTNNADLSLPDLDNHQNGDRIVFSPSPSPEAVGKSLDKIRAHLAESGLSPSLSQSSASPEPSQRQLSVSPLPFPPPARRSSRNSHGSTKLFPFDATIPIDIDFSDSDSDSPQSSTIHRPISPPKEKPRTEPLPPHQLMAALRRQGTNSSNKRKQPEPVATTTHVPGTRSPAPFLTQPPLPPQHQQPPTLSLHEETTASTSDANFAHFSQDSEDILTPFPAWDSDEPPPQQQEQKNSGTHKRSLNEKSVDEEEGSEDSESESEGEQERKRQRSAAAAETVVDEDHDPMTSSDEHESVEDSVERDVTEEEVASMGVNMSKVTYLSKWHVKSVVAADGNGVLVRVQGSGKGVNKSGNPQTWQTSSIVKRLHPKVIQTLSGSTYVLRGVAHRGSMEAKKYPLEIMRAFMHGFPDNWQDLGKLIAEPAAATTTTSSSTVAKPTPTPQSTVVKQQPKTKAAAGRGPKPETPKRSSPRSHTSPRAFWLNEQGASKPFGKDVPDLPHTRRSPRKEESLMLSSQKPASVAKHSQPQLPSAESNDAEAPASPLLELERRVLFGIDFGDSRDQMGELDLENFDLNLTLPDEPLEMLPESQPVEEEEAAKPKGRGRQKGGKRKEKEREVIAVDGEEQEQHAPAPPPPAPPTTRSRSGAAAAEKEKEKVSEKGKGKRKTSGEENVQLQPSTTSTSRSGLRSSDKPKATEHQLMQLDFKSGKRGGCAVPIPAQPTETQPSAAAAVTTAPTRGRGASTTTSTKKGTSSSSTSTHERPNSRKRERSPIQSESEGKSEEHASVSKKSSGGGKRQTGEGEGSSQTQGGVDKAKDSKKQGGKGNKSVSDEEPPLAVKPAELSRSKPGQTLVTGEKQKSENENQPWTEEETTRLHKAMNLIPGNAPGFWEAVAKAVGGGRTGTDCMLQNHRSFKTPDKSAAKKKKAEKEKNSAAPTLEEALQKKGKTRTNEVMKLLSKAASGDVLASTPYRDRAQQQAEGLRFLDSPVSELPLTPAIAGKQRVHTSVIPPTPDSILQKTDAKMDAYTEKLRKMTKPQGSKALPPPKPVQKETKKLPTLDSTMVERFARAVQQEERANRRREERRTERDEMEAEGVLVDSDTDYSIEDPEFD